MWVQSTFTYRVDLAFDLLALLLQVFLLKAVWIAVYNGRPSVGGIDLVALIAFLTIANLQIWLMPTMIASVLHERIREGQIALDLMRPVSFLDQLLVLEVGVSAGSLPFLLVVLPLALFVGGLQAPASPGAGLLYLASLALAFLINTLLDLLLGLIAFWTLEIEGFLTIYSFVSRFFAGALVPLWFFPPTLRVVANVLPFQAIAFVPVSIYLGKIEGSALLAALGLQLGWIVRRGDFDRYLIRPMSPFLQIMVERVRVNSFGDLLCGVILFAAANELVRVDWSLPALVYLVLAIVGGGLLVTSLKLAASTLAFRFLSGGRASFLVETVISSVGNYPLRIFGGALETTLTFAFPLAFVTYFPSTVLLGKTGELQVSPVLAYLSPLIGALWFGAAYLFWLHEVRAYQSAGH